MCIFFPICVFVVSNWSYILFVKFFKLSDISVRVGFDFISFESTVTFIISALSESSSENFCNSSFVSLQTEFNYFSRFNNFLSLSIFFFSIISLMKSINSLEFAFSFIEFWTSKIFFSCSIIASFLSSSFPLHSFSSTVLPIFL